MRVFIGLGSNLGNPVAQLESATRALAALPGVRLRGCSAFYRTAPVGYTGQPDFINAVCELDTALLPGELMQALLAIERTHGRVRDIPGGPRTLDLDLLLYGDEVLDQPGVTVPHPRLHERAFVLYPLQEIAPALVVPGHGPVAALVERCRGQAIERLAATAGQGSGRKAPA